MPQQDNFSRLADAIGDAERVLTDHSGGAVALALREILAEEGRRSITLRCSVHSDVETAPRSVIVKQTEMKGYAPDEPARFGEPTWRLFNEWAGLAFLSELDVAPPLAPRFYGGDRAHGVIVQEDLGTGENLVDPFLYGSAVDAERAMLDFMTVLAAMHSATARREMKFQRKRVTLGPLLPHTQFYTPIERATTLNSLSEVLDEIAVERPYGWESQLLAIFDALHDPGPFSVYTHGDPCPDNVLRVAGRFRLIDFEWGCFRHAMIDASYPLITFPTCWCAGRLPYTTQAHAMARYREVLASGCPAAQDDEQYERALLVGAAHWALLALLQFGRRGLREETEWGTAAVRQRLIARLHSFVEVAGASDRPGAVQQVAAHAAGAFERRWPDLAPLPLYPAFTR